MEPSAVIPSTVVIATVATSIMISAAPSTTAIAAAGARPTAGIGIPAAASEGSRSGTVPTTAAPSPGVRAHEKCCCADSNSESEYFAKHSNFHRLVVDS
jgi:hypothetical protein